jgi:hypothetical protein
VLWFIAVPVRLWKSFGSGSGSRQYLAQFSNNKKQNLSFSMSEAALFPRRLAAYLDFFTFHIPCYVGYGSKSGSGTGTVMHSGSGFRLAKKVMVPAV